MLGRYLDQGMDLKTAIQTMIETKLIGTWRLAISLVSQPDRIYLTKNVGPLYMGTSQDSIVFCSDQTILAEQSERFTFKKLKNNILYEVTDECVIEQTQLQKRIVVNRKPKRGYSHIFEEEIFESIEAMSTVTDDGAKFISDHQVVLGGFERAKEELLLVQNLVVAANGPSFIAAEYGALLMRHLRIFNSVKVLEAA